MCSNTFLFFFKTSACSNSKVCGRVSAPSPEASPVPSPLARRMHDAIRRWRKWIGLTTCTVFVFWWFFGFTTFRDDFMFFAQCLFQTQLEGEEGSEEGISKVPMGGVHGTKSGNAEADYRAPAQRAPDRRYGRWPAESGDGRAWGANEVECVIPLHQGVPFGGL